MIGLIAIFVLAYVFFISEIKRLNREKVIKQEILTEKINKVEMFSVEVQKLTTETRIVKLAEDSLSLVRPGKKIEKIEVPVNQILQIEKLVKEKYD